jgi:hypothetical protein
MRSLFCLLFALFIATGAQAALPPLDGVFINVEQENLPGVVTDIAKRNYRTIVVQYASNEYYEQATRFAELDKIFGTAKTLEEKQKKVVDIYVGLYYDESWNAAWKAEGKALDPFFTRNEKTITDLDGRYGDHPRFKGWYIAHEIGNSVERNDDTAAKFFKKIADKCRDVDKKRGRERRVLVSAYFNPHENYLQHQRFAQRLSTIQKGAAFNTILLQDGVGTRLLNPALLAKIVTPYYEAAKDAVGRDRLWGVIELFCCAKLVGDCQCKAACGRGPDRRFTKQRAAIVTHVSHTIAFEYTDIAKTHANCGATFCDVRSR